MLGVNAVTVAEIEARAKRVNFMFLVLLLKKLGVMGETPT